MEWQKAVNKSKRGVAERIDETTGRLICRWPDGVAIIYYLGGGNKGSVMSEDRVEGYDDWLPSAL